MPNWTSPETLALHGGLSGRPATGAVAVPIYQTTSYQFHDTGHAARCSRCRTRQIYTRIMNPTTDVLEKRIAALEGGAAALAVASGQAATAFAVQNLASAGDNIVSSHRPLWRHLEPVRQHAEASGIEVRFVDPADPENFRRATDDQDPRLLRRDPAQSEAARLPDRRGRRDRPRIRHSADRRQHCRAADRPAARSRRRRRGLFDDQIHRRPRHLDRRHSSSMAAISTGRAIRAPAAAQHARPELSWRGLDARRPSRSARSPISSRRASTLLRDLGAAMSPFNAFQIIQGLETLPLRMRAPLRERPAGRGLSRQAHRGDAGDPSRRSKPASQRSAPTRYLKAAMAAWSASSWPAAWRPAARFIDALKLLYHVANIGDARSLAIHPASTTHSQLSPEEQAATGVSAGYVRLSVGIEHIDDIIADLASGAARRHESIGTPDTGPIRLPTMYAAQPTDAWTRRLVARARLAVDDLIWPVFVIEGRGQGVRGRLHARHGAASRIDRLAGPCGKGGARSAFRRSRCFPARRRSEGRRRHRGAQPGHPDVPAPRARASAISPISACIGDVALDPYTDHGHDGADRRRRLRPERRDASRCWSPRR